MEKFRYENYCFLGLNSPVFSMKRNFTLQAKSAISRKQSALKNTIIEKNRSEPLEKKNKIEETEASVFLRSCLQKIYEKLKPLNKTLRAYATERPDKKPWEIGSYGPATPLGNLFRSGSRRYWQ